MQCLGVEPAAALQRFTIDRDMARRCAATGEFAKGFGQGIAIERLRNIMIGGVARRALDAK